VIGSVAGAIICLTCLCKLCRKVKK
jgi:hypothetical protein